MSNYKDLKNNKFSTDTTDTSDFVDTGTEGTKVAVGTTAERGSTTGQFRFNTTTGVAEYYDGTAFKSIDIPPTVISVDVTNVASDSGGTETFVITGTLFNTGLTVQFRDNGGTIITPDTTTRNSSTQITVTKTRSSFSSANEPYDIIVTNPSNFSANLDDAFNVDNSPVWQTASGSLGSSFETESFSTTVTAIDSDGDTISYSVASGALPDGTSLNSSTGVISGTLGNVASDTTYNFTITASGSLLTADRAFSAIIKNNTAPVWSTSSGNIGTFYDSIRTGVSITVTATDSDAGQSLSYSLLSGSLPTGLSLAASTGIISGDADAVGSDTTSTFTIRATDGLISVDRSFNIEIKAPVTINTRSSSNHTFPTGITLIKLLLVGGGGGGGNLRGNGAGGGGGGAGVYYNTNFSVTGGANYSWSIGGGGSAGGCNDQSGCSGGSSSFGGITTGMGGGGVSENTNNCNSGYGTGYTVAGGSGGCNFGGTGSNGGNAGTYTINSTTITNAGYSSQNSRWGGGGVGGGASGSNAGTTGASGGILIGY
jgi:hypothetical protein